MPRFPIHYVHDPSNGGLATAYNSRWLAPSRSSVNGCYSWTRTRRSRANLCRTAGSCHHLQARPEVAAIVPKLMVDGKVHFPANTLHRSDAEAVSASRAALSADVAGVQPQHLFAYNSGTTLRVAALRSIGGFPEEFWLDFLDHAVFHALLPTAIACTNAGNAGARCILFRPRQRALMASAQYTAGPDSLYAAGRNFVDRVLFRIWLLRHSRNLREPAKTHACGERRCNRLFSVPTDPRPGFPLADAL